MEKLCLHTQQIISHHHTFSNTNTNTILCLHMQQIISHLQKKYFWYYVFGVCISIITLVCFKNNFQTIWSLSLVCLAFTIFSCQFLENFKSHYYTLVLYVWPPHNCIAYFKTIFELFSKQFSASTLVLYVWPLHRRYCPVYSITGLIISLTWMKAMAKQIAIWWENHTESFKI